jgi:hypothetical protein
LPLVRLHASKNHFFDLTGIDPNISRDSAGQWSAESDYPIKPTDTYEFPFSKTNQDPAWPALP